MPRHARCASRCAAGPSFNTLAATERCCERCGLGRRHKLRQSGDGTGNRAGFGWRKGTGQSGPRAAVNAIDIRKRPTVRIRDPVLSRPATLTGG
jgi:hypothetical protein